MDCKPKDQLEKMFRYVGMNAPLVFSVGKSTVIVWN